MAKTTFAGPVASQNGFIGPVQAATATERGGVIQQTIPAFTDPFDIAQANTLRDLLIASGLFVSA